MKTERSKDITKAGRWPSLVKSWIDNICQTAIEKNLWGFTEWGQGKQVVYQDEEKQQTVPNGKQCAIVVLSTEPLLPDEVKTLRSIKARLLNNDPNVGTRPEYIEGQNIIPTLEEFADRCALAIKEVYQKLPDPSTVMYNKIEFPVWVGGFMASVIFIKTAGAGWQFHQLNGYKGD